MNTNRNSGRQNICLTRGGADIDPFNSELFDSGLLKPPQPQLQYLMDRESFHRESLQRRPDEEFPEKRSVMSLEDQKMSINSKSSFNRGFVLFDRSSNYLQKSSIGSFAKQSIEFRNSQQRLSRSQDQSLEIVMEWQDESNNQEAIEDLIKKLTLDKQSEIRPDRMSIVPQIKTGCICRKTHCLKFYCQCFQLGKLCTEACECVDCCNNDQHTELLEQTRMQIMQKKPEAFNAQPQQEVRSCNCKRSKCLKKYCECFLAGTKCGEHCKCEGCLNTEVSKEELLREPPQLEQMQNNKRVQVSRIEF